MILLCTEILSWINISYLVVLEFTVLIFSVFSSRKFTVGILFIIKKGNNCQENWNIYRASVFNSYCSLVIDLKAITIETTFS